MNPCLLLTVVLFPAFSMNAADKFDVAQLTPAATWKVDFVKDIQPIFAKACINCHGPEKQKAEFRVDQRAVLLTGGDSGLVGYQRMISTIK